MTQQITSQEQDALSAYLDNALNPRERQRLESQFQTRPDMRAALDDLRQTRLLLRQTPVLRVPRNFTLSPEMAGLRTRPARVYPLFQWAFTLASLFFILVFAGDLFSLPAAMPAMAPEAETFALEEASSEAMDTTAGENADVQRNIGEPALEEGGAGSTELLPPAEGASEGTPTPDMTFAMAETFTPTVEATNKSAPATAVVEAPMPAVEEPITMTFSSTMPEMPDTNPGEVQPMPVAEPNFWASRWRVPQVVLGVVVLLSGVGLFVFRRKTML